MAKKVTEDFFSTPATTVVEESFFSDEPVKKKDGGKELKLSSEAPLSFRRRGELPEEVKKSGGSANISKPVEIAPYKFENKPVQDNIASGQMQQKKQVDEATAKDNLDYLKNDRPKEIEARATEIKEAPKSNEPAFDGIDFMKQDIIEHGGGKSLKELPSDLESLNLYFDNDANNAASYFKDRTSEIDKEIKDLFTSKQVSLKPSEGDIGTGLNKPQVNPMTGKFDEQPVDETDTRIRELKEYKNKLYQAQSTLAKQYAGWLGNGKDVTTKGKIYERVMGDEAAAEKQRLEDKGIPITQEEKYKTDMSGLAVSVQELNDEYKGKDKDDEYYSRLANLELMEKGILNKYPEYKRQQGANLIAQLAVKDSKVKALAQSGSGELSKEIKDYLSATYGVKPNDLKGIDYGDIPSESFLGNVGKEITNAATGIVTGVTRIGGTLLGVDEDRLTYLNQKINTLGKNVFGENTYEQLQESPTLVNKDLQTIANPRAGKYNYNAATIKNAIGSGIGGLVGFIGGVKGAGKVLSLSDDAAMTSYLIGSGFEPNYQKANEVMGKDASEFSKGLYATGMGYLEALAFKVLPKDKIFFGSAETKAAQKELAKTLSGMTIDSINKDAIEGGFKKVLKSVVGTAEETAKIGGALTIAEMAKTATNVLLGEDEDAGKHIDEGVKNIEHLVRDLPFSMGIPLGLMEIPKYRSHSNRYKETIFDAGNNPDTHISTIRQAEEKGLLTKEEADKKIEVVEVMSNIVKSLPMINPKTSEPLTHQQQVEYAYNRVKEIAAKTKADEVKDAALAPFYKKEALELVDERTAILTGEHEAYNEMASIHQRAKEKGTLNTALDAGTKTQGVQFLQEQALTTPASTKRSLKGDEDLTIDLIARNEPQSIKEELKSLKADHKKLIEQEKKAEANEVQKNIDLLEAGLEKQGEVKAEKSVVVDKGEISGESVPLKEATPTESVEQPTVSETEGAGSSGVEGKSDVVVDKASNVGGDVEAQYNERKKSIEDKLNQQLEDNKDYLDDIADKGGTKTVRQKIYQEHTNDMVELGKWKMKEDLKKEDTPDGRIKKNSEFSSNQLTDAIPNSEVHYENKEDYGVTTITLRDKNTKKHIASIDIGTGDTIDGYAGVRIQVNGEHQGKGLSKHLYNLALTEAKKQGLKGLYTIDEMLKTPDKTIATRDNFVTRKNTDEKLKTQARKKYTNVADPNITFIENVSDKFIKKGATKLSEQSLSKQESGGKAPVTKPEGKSDVVVDEASNGGGDVIDTPEQVMADKAKMDFIKNGGTYNVQEDRNGVEVGLQTGNVRTLNGKKGYNQVDTFEESKVKLNADELKQWKQNEQNLQLEDISGEEYSNNKKEIIKKAFQRSLNEKNKAVEQSLPTQEVKDNAKPTISKEQTTVSETEGAGSSGVEGKSDVVVDEDFTAKGGNKAVDEKGEPITVYHGTSEEFDAFDKNAKSKSNHPSSKLGIFFTASEKLANLFNRDTDGVGGFPDYKTLPPKKGAKVVKANISIKNPKVFTAKEYKALMVSEDYNKTSDANDYIKLRDKLISEGYDGIKIENDFHNETGEYQSDQYVAFEPSQIKLIKEQSLSKQESGVKPEIKNEEAKTNIPNAETKDSITDKGTTEAGKEAGGGKEGKYEAKARKLAEKIMASETPDWLKIDDPNVKKSGIGVDEIKKALADATIKMGKLLDKGVEFSEAVKESVKDLVNMLGEGMREKIEAGFARDYEGKFNDLSGIKKGLVSDKIIEGVDLERVSDKDMMDMGRKILDTGEVKPEALVTKIITDGKGVLTPTEVVGLITYKRDIDNAVQDVYKQINDRVAKGEDIGTLGVEAKNLERQINDFDVMAVITAQQQSMAFRLRQRMLDKEYNVVTQIEKYKANNGGEIPADVEARFREVDKELKEVKAKLVEAEKKAAQKEGQDAVDNIKESVGREKKYTEEELQAELKKERASLRVEKKEKVHKAIDDMMDKWAKKISPEHLRGTDTKGVNADKVFKSVGAIMKKAYDAGELTTKIVEDAVKYVSEKLGNKDWGIEEFKNENWDEKLRAASEKKAKDKPTINEDGTVSIPNQMLRDLVKRGVTDIEGLAKEVYEQVKKDLPDITERQVRDYITDYGKKVNPTADALQTQVNTAKRVGRLLSELEDLRRMNKVQYLAKYQKLKPSESKITEREHELKRQIRALGKDIAKLDNTKTDAEQLRLAKERVKTNIEDLSRKIKNKDFAKPVKKPPVTDTEIQNLNHQKELLQEQYDKEQYKLELKNRKWWQKGEDIALEVFTGISRTLVAGVDLSAGLVQGTRLWFTNPKMSARATVEMFKQFASEKRNAEWFAKLKSSGVYEKIKQSKLAVTDEHGRASVKEGMFIVGWANKIYDGIAYVVTGGYKPATKFVRQINPIKASQRAFDGYVNYVRVEKYLELVKIAEKDGHTFEADPKMFEKLADHVNTITGRGSMGALETSSKWLSVAMFAPRKVISEIKVFTPYAFAYYAKMPKYVRQKALLNFATFIASFVSVNASIWAANQMYQGKKLDEDEDHFWDMTSSNFMTHNFGKTRVGVGGGAKSSLVFMARLFTGRFTDQYGKTTKLGERYGKQVDTRFDLGVNYLKGKASPGMGASIKYLDQKKGLEIDNTEMAKDLTIPMWMQDSKELYKDHPVAIGTLFNILSIFGAGVRVVEDKKTGWTEDDKKNPIYKPFIDAEIEMPKTNPKSIGINNEKEGKRYKLNEFDDKKITEFEKVKSSTRDALIKKVKSRNYVYKDKFGDVSLGNSKTEKRVRIPFNTLTPEQLKSILSEASTKGTKEAKKKVFGDNSEPEKDEEQ